MLSHQFTSVLIASVLLVKGDSNDKEGDKEKWNSSGAKESMKMPPWVLCVLLDPSKHHSFKSPFQAAFFWHSEDNLASWSGKDDWIQV